MCIDARLYTGTSGGVESVVIGMAHALSQLTDGDEEYLFLALRDSYDWLEPHIGGPCRILFGIEDQLPRTSRFTTFNTKLLTAMSKVRLRGETDSVLVDPARVECSDGTIERAGVDVMHFVKQSGFLTKIPSIYHPHDLQHRHFPEYFSAEELLYRESVYPALCRQAVLVAVTSSWVRRDVITHLGLPEGKVAVVPFAPVLTAYPDPSLRDLEGIRKRYKLPAKFVLYPAQTWAHKNHLGLLDALAALTDRGTEVNLVCTGAMNDFYSTVDLHQRALGLDRLVRFVGFVSPIELRGLYQLATAVVIPSKFEAASGPLWDAFVSAVPAACSNVTSLPEQAGNAALLFDPDDPGQIADALEKLWSDEKLRRSLAAKGRENVARFTWNRTVQHFRAHYRRIAGRVLSDDDHRILAAPPLL